MFTTRAEYAANFGLAEREMTRLPSDVKALVGSGNFTNTGLFAATAEAKGSAIFQVRGVLEAITALAKQDRATAEDVHDGPEPMQSAETLAALAYQLALLLRRFAPSDFNVLGALADAVEDEADAVKAQGLADMTEGLPWSIKSIGKMEQAERLRKQAIGIRADPERKRRSPPSPCSMATRRRPESTARSGHRVPRGQAGRRNPPERWRGHHDGLVRPGLVDPGPVPLRAAVRLRRDAPDLGVVAP